MPHRIALVGHCGIDGPRLQSAICDWSPNVQVDSCNDDAALHKVCEAGVDLLLVNRELTYGFDQEKGVDVIRSLRQRFPDVKCMLISDYEDAQKEARDVGAVPGFGKADIDSPAMSETLRRALESQSSA